MRFQGTSRPIGDNGPLIVLPGQDRHIVVTWCNSSKDWHNRAVIAGLLSIGSVMISVLIFDHPMKCGDDIAELYQRPPSQDLAVRVNAVIDDGAYYANFRGYGREQTIALLISGGLDSEGAILVRNVPKTPNGKPPFIRKDITPAIVGAALSNTADTLACVDGF